TPTLELDEAVAGADAVVVATNHADFRTHATLQAIAEGAADDALVVDPWNCWGAGQVFAYARELSAMAPAPR
ncbi:MAG: UDP-N-acetyl-D-mannosaminuronic acid dehydrogenase, partial [Solirubrobacteraceae bacterium]|nr:UDP-N-acetyl-D-mannosaminuronic acid dehydrogenase [Solirubrobacteraceae bacterium]